MQTITKDTSDRAAEAVSAVFEAAELALAKMAVAKRPQLAGPRPPKPSERKRRRLEVRASRRANRPG